MRSLTYLLTLAASVSAHTIFQRMKVDGTDQGQLQGIRAPQSNNPILNVKDANFACNSGFVQPVSSKVIDVKAGSQISAFWGHVIGGAQSPGDAENPIAKSHKGPIITYLASVDNAATASSSGLKWFKIQEEGVNGGTWAVDKMVQGGGWYTFQLPSCIAPGQYLMRHELIALHSANNAGQAQFYVSCAQIRVTSGGSFSPSSTVSFPGAYDANHPGIKVSIYDKSGNPNNGGRTYSIPGPTTITC